ncbi:MAG: response regulator [Nitrospinota bacterium]|nr:response regulator [Nitrospinota bacterium]
MTDSLNKPHRFEAFMGEKTREELEVELQEAHELIEAIRSGAVDVVRGRGEDNTLLKLERIELVEERKRLLRKLQESNESLLAEIRVRKETEAELHSALHRAGESTLLRDKFVSLVSHDLRSPVATLSGFMNLLLSRNMDRLDQESLLILQKSIAITVKMDTLIQELLEISRIKRGTVQLNFVFVNIYLLLEKVINSLEENAFKKGVILVNRAPPRLFVYADEPLLAQVIQNLTSNAIKFCSRGDLVTITASEEQGQSIIRVTDTGVGMTPEIIENLFDYEKKSNRAGTEGETGTGLGLALCNDIVEAHRGQILVESEPGKGSVFTVALERVKPQILIVDNDEESVANTRQVIEGMEADVEEASDSGQALEIVAKSPPHLILLDLFMPGDDGLILLEKLREGEGAGEIPIIVVSNSADMSHREKALRLGANDFVIKARQDEELAPRIEKYIGCRPLVSADKGGPASIKGKTRRILFVESDEALLDAMESFFEEQRIHTLTAHDEKEALQVYSDQMDNLDALVVDMCLPSISGMELARRNFEGAFLPMVIFTSRSDARMALELAKFGVKDYLVKPVDSQFLLSVVENAIRRHGLTGGAAEAEALQGNVNSIFIPSKTREVQKALGWIERKIAKSFSQTDAHKFIIYTSEFLMNAHEHGNLKLTEEEKVELLNKGTFGREVARREKETTAKIHLTISILKKEVALALTDEGAGFSYKTYLEMADEEILGRLNLPCGRGILMARQYFDSIEYSQNGARVTLTKKIG